MGDSVKGAQDWVVGNIPDVKTHTLKSITTDFISQAANMEDTMKTALDNVGPNPSQGDLLVLQQLVQEFSAKMQSLTGILRVFGDILKAESQNIR